ncbi:MAG: hypothetical protein A2901_01575 [Elusimicrobia bacterium RIFCSPLOWO2_01_FULL_54_10]|nr:MAG: hypothetical protein A2901_01575 [Elusimicrobia bacterium RIFCSPLOWO2_01_FULL_54_10]
MIAKGLLLGSVLALVNGGLAFLLLRWAAGRKDKIFYGAFFGGMLWKLAGLFGVFIFLLNRPLAHIPSVLLSMAAVTFLINLVEIQWTLKKF